MYNILVVDDDPTQRRLLESIVTREGFRVDSVDSGMAALDHLSKHDGDHVDLIMLDLVMPGMDGIETLSKIKPQWPDKPVLVLTAQSGVDVIVKAMQAGASDFIVKPAAPERLRVSIENAMRIKGLTGQLSRMERRTAGVMTFEDLVYKSPIMDEVVRLAGRGAGSSIPVLLEGESGSGKEVIARAVQGSSERAGKPFIAVNCGAIPENLVESILFGHEKGSFTGADKKHVGKFKEADGGTLFLDEVGELKPEMQVKLLRVIQEGEIDPIGSKAPEQVDVRLISATNKNLLNLVREGHFREDLYYRINVFPLYIPPLRDRREDIPELARHFLANFAESEGRAIRDIDKNAMDMLVTYDWPGNVRQLENTIFRAVVLCDGEALNLIDFPQVASTLGIVASPMHQANSFVPDSSAESPAAALPLSQTMGGPLISALDGNGALRKLEAVEHEMIRLAIDQCKGQMSDVARKLGIGRSTLYRKIREMELDVVRSAAGD